MQQHGGKVNMHALIAHNLPTMCLHLYVLWLSHEKTLKNRNPRHVSFRGDFQIVYPRWRFLKEWTDILLTGP